MKEFAKLNFKSNAVLKLKLPNIEYPIPKEKLKLVYSLSEQEINPTILIYWILDYMNFSFVEREYYEKALLEICENHAPVSGKTEFWFKEKSKYSHNPDKLWFLKLGKVNLNEPIVVYERKNKIQLVVARNKEDKTKIETSFFSIPHQDLIASLRLRSIDTQIGMLSKPQDANSFGGFQHETWKMHNAISYDKGEDCMVNWEYGLGWKTKENFDEKYRYALNLNPLPNDWIAFLFNIVLSCEKNKYFEKIVGEQSY